MTAPDPATALAQTIRDRHKAQAKLRCTTLVSESSHGRSLWTGLVYTFDIEGHPSATRCYGLASLKDDDHVELSALLHEGPIQSPQEAVKAYVAAKLERVRSPPEG